MVVGDTAGLAVDRPRPADLDRARGLLPRRSPVFPLGQRRPDRCVLTECRVDERAVLARRVLAAAAGLGPAGIAGVAGSFSEDRTMVRRVHHVGLFGVSGLGAAGPEIARGSGRDPRSEPAALLRAPIGGPSIEDGHPHVRVDRETAVEGPTATSFVRAHAASRASGTMRVVRSRAKERDSIQPPLESARRTDQSVHHRCPTATDSSSLCAGSR
jgi:hypothetical protein